MNNLTPKQVAVAIGTSEASIKRWCDKGLIPSVRTAGGHRRLPISGVMDFLRRSGHTLVRPELLGLPAAIGRAPVALDRAGGIAQDALATGDAERFRSLILELHLARHPLADIFDQVIAPAFVEIGAGWEHQHLEVYQERRACEICTRALLELANLLPEPPPDAPLAIGGSPAGDPYSLPSRMAELVLKQSGWRASNLGYNLPFDTLLAAARQLKPRLFWLSVSWIESPAYFESGFRALYDELAPHGGALTVGGRAISEELRRTLRYTAFCDSMARLTGFALALNPQPVTQPLTLTDEETDQDRILPDSLS